MRQPNQTLETNRRLASPFAAGHQFERALHAQACFSGGGRSALRYAGETMKNLIIVCVSLITICGCAHVERRTAVSKKLWGMMACSENLEADVKMYEAMLGKEATEEWDGCKSFDLGNTKLYVMGAPNAAPIMVVQVEDIKAEIERLRKEGFEVMEPFNVKVGIFTFYQDKKGNQYGLLQQSY